MSNQIVCRLLVASSLVFFSAINPAYAAGEVQQSTGMTQEVSAKVDVNKATTEQLAMISGIGGKKAKAIIEYRETYGDFAELAELVKVKGIGESTLKKIEPYVSL